jgi:hypothetical protein
VGTIAPGVSLHVLNRTTGSLEGGLDFSQSI